MKYDTNSYCINLNDKEYKFINVLNELDRLSIYPNRFVVEKHKLTKRILREGVNEKSNQILESHLKLLKHLESIDQPCFIIFEDDIKVIKDINIDEIISSAPKDWDVIYLGGMNHYHAPKIIDHKFYKCKFSFNAHAFIVKKEFIPKMIEHLEKREYENDVIFAYMQSKGVGNWYGLIEDAIIQDGIEGPTFITTLSDNCFSEIKKLKGDFDIKRVSIQLNTFVWILKDGSEDNQEVKYSIRSVLKYHPNANVCILGSKPKWYNGEFYPFPDIDECPYVNVWKKLEYACIIFDSFVYMDDDFYLTGKFENIHYHNTTFDEVISECGIKENDNNTNWEKVLINTRKNLPDGCLMHCIHAPLPIISKNFLRISNMYPQRLASPSLVPRQIYCHHERVFGENRFMPDNKHTGVLTREIVERFPFFSIGEQINDVLDFFEELYNEPSQYETINVFGCDVNWWCFDRIASKIISHGDMCIKKIYATENDIFKYNLNWIHSFNWRLTSKVKKSKVISMSIYDHYTWKDQPEMFKKSVSMCDFICVSSMKIFEELKNECIMKPIYLLNDGVDFDLFKPIVNKENSSLRYMWCGRTAIWNSIKRVDDIVDAFVKLNISDKIDIINFDSEKIPHDEMPNIYNQHDIYICFSTKEGTPNPVLEAAACGLYIITTDVGIVKELSDIIPGIKVVHNQEELISEISYCEENADYIRSLGEMNAKYIRESKMFDWSDISNRLYELYDFYSKNNSKKYLILNEIKRL